MRLKRIRHDKNLDFSGGCILRNCASDIDGKRPAYQETDTATTFLARDHKGMANQNSNAVFEIYEVNRMDEIKVIGQMDNSIDHTHEDANRVYDENGIALTIQTYNGGNRQPKIIDSIPINVMQDETCRTIKSQYGQTSTVNFEKQGTFGATGVVHISQASNEPVPCKIGGGGGFELSKLQNKKRASNRERRDMPNADNGEYP